MMKKQLFAILAISSLVACSELNTEAPSTTTEEDQSLKQKAHDTSRKDIANFKISNEEMIESQKSPEIQKAENLVRQYLELADSTTTVVEFDHKQDEKIIIHVYDIIDEDKKTEHTATRGWYSVTLDPKNIDVLN